jgi:AcrR family transcriptional regulator
MSAVDLNRDTRKRIIDASIHLFGLKGFTGASTREIAKVANVNIASLNYHFRSKQNLLQEVSAYVIEEFEQRFATLHDGTLKSSADYAVKIFNSIMEDELKCLNHFKLYLDAENCPREFASKPMGFEQFNTFFKHELNASVPEDERVWMTNIIITYTSHMAVLLSSSLGKKHIEKYMPEKHKTVADYLHRLVTTMIRDLNQRYAQ